MRSKNRALWTKAYAGIVGVVLLWASSPYVIFAMYDSPEERAAFGDVFGAVNALFSGLAFLGLIVAIFLQKQELEEQRQEFARSRQAQEDSARALERRLAFDESLVLKRRSLDLYDEWHAPDMHESRIELGRHIDSLREAEARLDPLSGANVRSPATIHMFRIYHFFEKWALLSAAGQIDKDLLAKLLRIYVQWWDERLFSPLCLEEKDEGYIKALETIRTEVLSTADAVNT